MKTFVKAQPLLPMTADNALKILDAFFAQAETLETQRLWDVLSALRGPDSGDGDLKAQTTAVIRRAAFPRLAQIVLQGRYKVSASFALARTRFVDPARYSHFERHARSACTSLRRMGRKVGA